MMQLGTTAILLMVHNPQDALFYHHVATAIRSYGECAVLSCLPDDLPLTDSKVCIVPPEERLHPQSFIGEWLQKVCPDYVITDTPRGVYLLHRLQRQQHQSWKIIYYLTEWYPSKKNLRDYPVWVRPLRALMLSAAFVYAVALTHAVMAGEYYKSLPIRFLFPHKPFAQLTYAPHQKWFADAVIQAPQQELRLFYAGPLTEEKGWNSVLSVAEQLSLRHPDKCVRLVVYTKDTYTLSTPSNLVVEIHPEVTLDAFCRAIDAAHIALDLRKADVENTHCLPIKLFYYMAAGKPAVFSRLKAIEKEVTEVEEFDRLLPPDDILSIVNTIDDWWNHPAEYTRRAQRARQTYLEHYTWNKAEEQLLQLLLHC